MTSSQIRFLRLHQTALVERTQAIFQGAMIRATSACGQSAAVTIDEVAELIRAGLLVQSHGLSFTAAQGAQAA
jgi:hypothetical protein